MKTEVKTSVDGLEIGMFVSRLDRPWIRTPFDLEGVKITSPEDIERIRKYCSYVYIDVEQGISPHPRYWILDKAADQQLFGETPNPQSRAAIAEIKREYQSLRKTTYQNTEEFRTEIETATKTSESLTHEYRQLLVDLEKGRDIDLSVVKAGVSDMVESVNRNPAAMMWIVQLKKLDEYTYSRALGTSVWCATFGRHLGLEISGINKLALGGLLLDLGKSRIPPDILNKKGELTDAELEIIRQHVDQSVRVLISEERKKGGKNSLDYDVLQMVATHHERYDGSGYPQGLANNDIPMYGRIAGIVDSYDAMTSERPYRESRPLSPHEAITELYSLRDDKFQGELVEQFIQTVGLYPTGSLVELNTGQVGAVIETNGLRRLQPTVMLLLDENKEPYSQFKRIDLTTTGEAFRVERGLEPGAYGINMQELFL